MICALAPVTAAAPNGATAVAVPVHEITVDGDLSDWPEGMRRYPFRDPDFGSPRTSEKDFDAHFCIGFVYADSRAKRWAFDARDGRWDRSAATIDARHSNDRARRMEDPLIALGLQPAPTVCTRDRSKDN